MSRQYFYILYSVIFLILSAGSPVQAGVDYSQVGYRTTTIFSDGNRSRWIMGESYTNVGLSARAFGLRLRLDFAHSLPDGDLRWGRELSSNAPQAIDDDSGRLSGRIAFQEKYFQTVVTAESSNRKISTSLKWRRKTGNRHEISNSIWLRPFGFLEFGIKRSRLYPLPSHADLYYDYGVPNGSSEREGGLFNFRAPVLVNEMGLRMSPIKNIILESRIREAGLRPEEPSPGEFSPGTYLGVMDGYWRDNQIRAEWHVAAGWRTSVEYRQARLRTRFRAFDNGRQFAHFGKVYGDGEQISFKVNHNSWFLNLYYGRGDGEIKGAVEAWPFVGGLLRFLGERRHFIGKAEVKWKYAVFGGSVYNSRTFRLKSQLEYLHVLPDLRYSTWRPLAIGFGIDDLKAERLELERADLMRLTLKPSIKWSRLIMEFEISQWIPISLKKIDRIHASEPSDPQPDKPKFTDDGNQSLWGGFSAMVRVKTRLH